jgi:hypothetical protein
MPKKPAVGKASRRKTCFKQVGLVLSFYLRAKVATMAADPIPQPQPIPEPTGSPYCSDPNCVYCKNLKEAQEEITRESSRSSQ